MYRQMWRWHFYAGLFCIPLVFILSVSGAVYLFKPQIENAREARYNDLAVEGERAEPNAQIDAAINVLPGAKFTSYRLAQSETDAVRITLTKNGERFYVYLNPYSLFVLDTVAVEGVLIEWFKSLHGELLAGKTGSVIVELAASWAIVLVLTGLYLWWPRRTGQSLAGVLYPRLHAGYRTTLRDMHAVGGFWLSFFVLFLLISGLPWTTVWGGALKESRKMIAQMESSDWSQSRAEEKISWMSRSVSQYDLKPSVVDASLKQGLAWPVELSVHSETNNQWKAASQSQNRPLRDTVIIDGNNGQVIKRMDFANKPMLDKVIGVGIAAHEGQLFGWFNQLLGLLTAVGIVLMSVFGVLMWLAKKPAGRLGAPPKKPKQLPIWCLLPLLLLPTALFSVLVLILLDKTVMRCAPAVQHWLGLTARAE